MYEQNKVKTSPSKTIIYFVMLLSFFAISIGSPSIETQASDYHKLSNLLKARRVEGPSEKQTTTIEKPQDESTTTTQEVIAPTPPITFDPEESTQTSLQSTKDEPNITSAELTTVINDLENTTTSQENLEDSESTSQSSSSNEKTFEAGKLTVVKKDTPPLEYILSEFASHLYKNSDIIQTLYYQGTFLIRHLLIIPDADIFTLLDHEIIRWLNLYAEFFMQNKII